MSTIQLQDWDFPQWTVRFIPLFTGVIGLGLKLLNFLVIYAFEKTDVDRIPIKGKHLDKFEPIDTLFLNINKLFTVVFVYHTIYVCYYTPSIKWKLEELTLMNTAGSMIAFYIFYDFFYMWFHRILHIRAIYPYVHKHHHRQKAPSRGSDDAINVHPFEFFVGEYLHLATVYMIPCHVITVAIFIAIGGIFASLNHTRYNISIPGLYRVDYHDVHHRLPESNYGQYIMFWDYIFGSFRPYASAVAVRGDKD